jgi:hypothetical protein
MKRLLIACFILGMGTTVVCGLYRGTTRLASSGAELQLELANRIQLEAQAHEQLARVEERVRELKRAREEALSRRIARTEPDALLALAGVRSLPFAEQREQLLAAFGFNWNSIGDYVIVSKETLREIAFQGMDLLKPSEAACKVLAITPVEQAGLEAIAQKVAADYRAWAQTHVERSEPASNVVAQYHIPNDPEFSQSISNTFVGGIFATLGAERGRFMQVYSGEWMSALGMFGFTDTSLTVTRYQAGQKVRLNYTVKHNASTMSSEDTPHQPFPPTFLPLFPNGWKDLAKAEGFELPSEFQGN